MLEEANGETRLQAKKEHLKPRPLPQKRNINQQSFQVLMVQRYLEILTNWLATRRRMRRHMKKHLSYRGRSSNFNSFEKQNFTNNEAKKAYSYEATK